MNNDALILLVDSLKSWKESSSLDITVDKDHAVAVLDSKDLLLSFCSYILEQPSLKMTQLIDITAVDYLKELGTFCMVYHFLSIKHNTHLIL